MTDSRPLHTMGKPAHAVGRRVGALLIAAWLVWVTVLAAVLLRASAERPRSALPENNAPDEAPPIPESLARV